MTKIKSAHPFNSPVECGLRSIAILEATHPEAHDLQKIVFYDYLLVHSGDANGPESLHPATPHRSSEVLVRRRIVENGIQFMMSRKLVNRFFDSRGILYVATDKITTFLDCIKSTYVDDLRSRAEWVVREFKNYSDLELEQFFNKNFGRWGGEFEKQALFKHRKL